MWRVAASAGFTVPRALETMGARADAGVEAMRQHLMAGTQRGASVADLARAGGPWLPAFDAGLLELGDESGRLEASLGHLAEFYARKQRWMLTVKKRLAYPMYLALAAAFIAPFSLLYFGHVLAYLLVAGGTCAALLLFGGAIVAGAAQRFGCQPALVRARLARALASAVEAGLPLQRALRLSASASGDVRVAEFVDRIDERALGTQPLAVTLATCPCMSPDFLAVLDTAERTGDYASTLTRLAAQYEDGFR